MVAQYPSTHAQTDAHALAATVPAYTQEVTVSREALGQLLLHIADAYQRFPNRKLRQALMITEHLLGIDNEA